MYLTASQSCSWIVDPGTHPQNGTYIHLYVINYQNLALFVQP